MVIVKITLDLLSVLALASKQIKQGRFSEYVITFMLSMTQYAIEKFTKNCSGRVR